MAGKNVLGTELQSCSTDPMTGFYRDGCCQTGGAALGLHTVCTRVTEDFLAFSKSRGNDLSTPNPLYDFPGLKEGDQWCLCAARFLQAYQAGKAPRVSLQSTHRRALEIVPMEALREMSIALN